MIGLDTNVLVRYMMQDDPAQSPKATALVESLNKERPGFVTLVALVELYWVLTSCYELSKKQVAQALDVLLRSDQIVLDRADHALRALRIFEQGKADFPDCLIECVGSAAGCEHTVTFDAGAAKHAGMVLIR